MTCKSNLMWFFFLIWLAVFVQAASSRKRHNLKASVLGSEVSWIQSLHKGISETDAVGEAYSHDERPVPCSVCEYKSSFAVNRELKIAGNYWPQGKNLTITIMPRENLNNTHEIVPVFQIEVIPEVIKENGTFLMVLSGYENGEKKRQEVTSPFNSTDLPFMFVIVRLSTGYLVHSYAMAKNHHNWTEVTDLSFTTTSTEEPDIVKVYPEEINKLQYYISNDAEYSDDEKNMCEAIPGTVLRPVKGGTARSNVISTAQQTVNRVTT